VQLLNFALRQDVAVDCDWHGGRKVVYFRAIPGLSPRSIRGASGRTRLVFNPKYKKKAPDEISYCQHAALEWQFPLHRPPVVLRADTDLPLHPWQLPRLALPVRPVGPDQAPRPQSRRLPPDPDVGVTSSGQWRRFPSIIWRGLTSS